MNSDQLAHIWPASEINKFIAILFTNFYMPVSAFSQGSNYRFAFCKLRSEF